MNKELAQYINTLLAEKQREIAGTKINFLQEQCKMQKRETDALQAALDNKQKERKKPDWSLKYGSSHGEWEKKTEESEPAVGGNQTKTETEPAMSDNQTVVWKAVVKQLSQVLFGLLCLFVFISFFVLLGKPQSVRQVGQVIGEFNKEEEKVMAE